MAESADRFKNPTITLTTPKISDDLKFLRMTGRESLARAFHYEVEFAVENGKIHQVVDVSWLELRWIGRGIGCALRYGPHCQFNSPPPFAWSTQRAMSLRDKRRPPPGSTPQWFRRADE